MKRRHQAKLAGGAALLLVTTPAQTEQGSVTTLVGTTKITRAKPARSGLATQLIAPLRNCWLHDPGPAPTAHTALKLDVAFGPGGRVVGVRSAATDRVPQTFIECARRRAFRLAISPPDDGLKRARLSYVFLPAMNTGSQAPPPQLEARESSPFDATSRLPVVTIQLKPRPTHPLARLVLQIQWRIDVCTGTNPMLAGDFTLDAVVAADGTPTNMALYFGRGPDEFRTCVLQSLRDGERFVSHEGAVPWRLRLKFFADDFGVSLEE